MTAEIKLASLADARIIKLPRYMRDGGALVVAEGLTHVPFAIARLFTVQAPAGAERGHHAHRRCSQFMLCAHGAIDVMLDDGSATKTVHLIPGPDALLVPPMIWIGLAFIAPQTVLSVLCDRPYEADDYIRDYEAFLAARKAAGP